MTRKKDWIRNQKGECEMTYSNFTLDNLGRSKREIALAQGARERMARQATAGRKPQAVKLSKVVAQVKSLFAGRPALKELKPKQHYG
jgi:hypothetical protein